MPRGAHATEKPKSLSRAAKLFMRSLKPWMIPLIFAVILAIAATVCSIFGPNILGQMTNSAIEDYQTAVAQTGGQMPTP